MLALAVLRAFIAARCRSAATQQVAAPVPLALPRPATCSAATTSPKARIGLTAKALCRLYEAELSAVSNSYALKRIFAAAADGMNSR